MSGRRIVDLFAGPGGWSEGLRMLGHRELGIEWDADACATAIAAGHDRLQADVAELDPQEFAPCWGLIASPPCQAWSMAGKGDGRRDIEHVVACAMEIAAGNDTRAEHAAKCTDDRSLLVVEPLRWALALQPAWLAFEQVPPVLELWTLFAQILEREGWSCWTGVLEAERYGVPQTRERAILMAHRDQVAQPPQATHQRYVPGEPQRHDITLDGEILPWISMAEALGWESGRVGFADDDDRNWTVDRPSTTVAGDPRVHPPGHKINGDDIAAGRGDYEERRGANAIRVTLQQAAVLQSFRPDYPWPGNRSSQFRQVGNAVPPLLARAVLRELAGDASQDREAAA